MKHLTAAVLALSMTAFAGAASAQQYSTYPAQGYSTQGDYDYARVLRVTPVYDPRRYAAGTGGERCTESRTYADGYRDERYDEPYGGYRDDRRYDGYGDGYRAPTQGGSTAATIIGGIVGAVVGSQVGGGSARYATSAIGTMVGSQVGKQIYDNAHRQDQRVGRVVACDPVQVGAYGRDVASYDVVYEYGGRQYATRTSYDPGDRIRVRVDVRPE
jgi:uncharacterized protein YcfJ